MFMHIHPIDDADATDPSTFGLCGAAPTPRQSSSPKSRWRASLAQSALCVLVTLFGFAGCISDPGTGAETGDDATGAMDTHEGATGDDPELYSLGSLVLGPSGDRTLYIQTLSSLNRTAVDNASALEFPGNARHWAQGRNIFIGYGDAPKIERYTVDDQGQIHASGVLDFSNTGLAAIPAGVAFISDAKAYLFAEREHKLMVWDPSALTITGQVDLSMLAKDGLATELWNPTVADDRVYVPVRYVNWESYAVFPEVRLMVLDSRSDQVLSVLHDERCIGASQPVALDNGDVYVLADGRNYFAQLAAQQSGHPVPPTCLLRVRAGSDGFEQGYLVELPMQVGLDAATQMWHVAGNTAFMKMYYPAQVTDEHNVEGFNFWLNPIFKLWRVELGDAPRWEEISNAPFSMVAFGGHEVNGEFFIGETSDAENATVYSLGPNGEQLEPKFTMVGALRGLYRLD